MLASDSQPPAPRRKPLAVAVVTSDTAFLASAAAACGDIAGVAADTDLPVALPTATDPRPDPLHDELVARAREYLARSGQALAITLVQAPTIAAAAARLARLPADSGPVGIVLLDAASTGLEADPDLSARVEELYAALAAAGVATVRSPYSVLVHRRTPPWASGIHVVPDRLVERVLVPRSPGLVRTEQLIAIVDFVERTFERPRYHKAALRELRVTLGEELVRFLGDRAGADWLLLYYTSSSVTALVDYVEQVADARGVTVLRAANEHGLACGALANHLLHERPFLCVIGLAMGDEFRGTLANLRAARARGFIVCPEADLGKHFSFQGTITADEDARAVLAARRVPFVYLDSLETLPERLEEACRLFDEGMGPVVLLTTPWLLSTSDPLPRAPVPAPAPQALPKTPTMSEPRAAPVPETSDTAAAAALALINHGPSRVLWQLGHMSPAELEMVLAISERAGIALVDTLGHPGPTHRAGRPIANHLGTLGLYGFNRRWYAFLHEAGGRLRPRGEQCVFFLKSRVGERATSFTPARREALRMVQITDRVDHVAPDVELAIVSRVEPFLRRILAGLEVEPRLVAERRAAIAAATENGDDPAARIASVPMSSSYFFTQLGALVADMVADEYTYTGVYDVGRSSVSALRAVPRTGHGYSGWYGRALMGDAPAALPILAVTEPGDVIAFVGDGGRSIVADPIPALLENALAYPERFADRSVTIFYFSNGTYSGIRTYRERLAGRWGGRQMRTVDLLDPEGEQSFGPLRVVRRRIVEFDATALRAHLLARGRLNVLTVVLGHDNDDNGFTFVTSGWRREVPVPR